MFESPGVVFCGVATPCDPSAALIRNPPALVLVPQSQDAAAIFVGSRAVWYRDSRNTTMSYKADLLVAPVGDRHGPLKSMRSARCAFGLRRVGKPKRSSRGCELRRAVPTGCSESGVLKQNGVGGRNNTAQSAHAEPAVASRQSETREGLAGVVMMVGRGDRGRRGSGNARPARGSVRRCALTPVSQRRG